MYLNDVIWNTTGMERGSIDGKHIECKTTHLSSFAMAILEEKVNNLPKGK